MPDKVRSVDDMVADMEKAVEEPEGNTSSGKHRQHVAQKRHGAAAARLCASFERGAAAAAAMCW